jgi:hypothetical protein
MVRIQRSSGVHLAPPVYAMHLTWRAGLAEKNDPEQGHAGVFLISIAAWKMHLVMRYVSGPLDFLV